MNIRKRESGFSVVFILLIIVVVSATSFTAWRVLSSKESNNTAQTTIEQNFNPNSQVDTVDCKAKPVLLLPADISKVTSILYPGQLRGGNYKPHGGFRLDSPANEATVTLPLNAKLIDGSRYIEQGEMQYMFDFETECKIRMRFDHLAVLSPTLQAQADMLPLAKPDDSRTTKLTNVSFKAGDVLATKVGFVKNNNASFDFGLYDYNQKNTSSNDSAWAAAHQSDNEQHGVCWFDYLSTSDRDKVLALPATDQQSGKTSDYCK